MALPFGLSFGSSKKKSSTDSTITKQENTSQAQSTNTTGTTNQSSTGSTTGSSQGSSTTNQTASTSNTAVKTSDQLGQTNLFNTGVQTGLEGLVTNLLGTAGSMNPATAALAFDSDAFIADAVNSATAKAQTGLDATLGGIADMVGAKAGNSSMGDLLAARASGDAAAGIAGIRSQAAQTAAGITNANAQTQLAGQKTDTDALAQFLAVLKGGTATQTTTGSEGTTATGTSTQTGTTATNESTQQNTASQQTQTIQQLVDALLNSTTNSTGTESTKTKGSDTSIGLKLGK